MKRTALSAAALAVAAIPAGILAGSASAAGQSANQSQNIVQVASGDPQFSTLVDLVKKAGLVNALSTRPAKTVFAPTNAAFARVPKATLNRLARDRKALADVLTYHVVAGSVPAARVVGLNGKTVKALNGDRVRVAVRNGNVFLNGNTRVTKTNIRTSNGIIHVINRVLLPPAN